MTFNATWSMAVGGMVGGGIFSVLGVIIAAAGQWAWLSFLIAGVIALISAHSYSQLSIIYGEGGGAFTFLREVGHKGFAGSLSWILILGYILTLSVYAFTFGNYVAHVFEIGSWFPRLLSLVIIAILTMVNLRGVSGVSKVGIVSAYGKLLALLALAAVGISQWSPNELTQGIEPKAWHSAIVGAATIFMAYEGFQLLSYDYKDLKKPDKTLPKATIWAVIAVILVYILVALGATMLVGANTLVEQKEVALSIAGKKAFGITGLLIMSIAAALSTGSAINATLFSTARLMEYVAEKRYLPHIFTKQNKEKMPFYAVLSIAGFASILAVIGSLSSLVDAASIIFLFTFGIVNYLAFKKNAQYKWFSLVGAISCALAIVIHVVVQIQNIPFVIIGLFIITIGIFLFRAYILRFIRK